MRLPALLLPLLFFVPTAKESHILFLGDSLTAGYGLSPEQAFPALVEQELNKSLYRVKVTNAGLSGETSAGGLSRVDWMLRTPVDVLVLELGANDGLRGLPIEQTKNNLQAIINKVKAKYPAVKIILTGMMVPPNMGSAYATEFKKIYPALAEKNNALLMPFLLDGVAGHEKLNQADGIHPTAEGHRIIAKNLIKYLLKVL
ncbi:MAG: arylesterase [Bacteroidetes bacterium]|nr:arylesterase [Bacteroidota bacterium]MBS1539772.1 arylesterase [Bacteroidota bacterium]